MDNCFVFIVLIYQKYNDTVKIDVFESIGHIKKGNSARKVKKVMIFPSFNIFLLQVYTKAIIETIIHRHKE